MVMRSQLFGGSAPKGYPCKRSRGFWTPRCSGTPSRPATPCCGHSGYMDNPSAPIAVRLLGRDRVREIPESASSQCQEMFHRLALTGTTDTGTRDLPVRSVITVQAATLPNQVARVLRMAERARRDFTRRLLFGESLDRAHATTKPWPTH